MLDRMTVKELISGLEEVYKIHGDIRVVIYDDADEKDLTDMFTYSKDGKYFLVLDTYNKND